MSEQNAPALPLQPGERYVLAASTGGHLTQLLRFAESADVDASSLWVTFDTTDEVRWTGMSFDMALELSPGKAAQIVDVARSAYSQIFGQP